MKDLELGGKIYKVLSETPLAHGGNQICYELNLSNSVIIDDIPYNNLLCKRNLNGNGIDSKSLDVFKKLKKFNIATVEFMLEAIYDHQKVLITENLNNRESKRIYVSSNYHPKDERIEKLLAFLQQRPYKEDHNEISKEFYLSNNKLDEIKNYEQVIKCLKSLSKLCTEKRVFFPEDAIFFGVNTEKQSIDDVLLGDYGSIIIDASDCDSTVNENAIRTALEEFKMHFVKE